MANLLQTIRGRVRAAMELAFGAEFAAADPLVTPATDPRFGHYQCNAAMGLAKRLGRKPRDIAAEIIARLKLDDLCSPPEIAGAGFINLRLTPEAITDALRDKLFDDRLGVAEAEPCERVVVDFSSPNIAKDLHVGHLRSTIIGDSLARVFEFLGHTVLRRNHVGDWGTQFGMLIAQLKELHPEALRPDSQINLIDIVKFYRQAKERFDNDPEFKERARAEVVKLQAGEAEARQGWQTLCDASRLQFEEIYSILDIKIEEKGESFYNPFIPEMLEELRAKGMIVESDGAQCIFPEALGGQTEDALPLIVVKRDGGYNYDTTDMATIRYRAFEEGANRILYVTDAGQALHFQLVFAAAAQAGWLENTRPVHVPFGMVLGSDNKKFKTRSGDTVGLRLLLDEAVERARAIVDEKNPELCEAGRAQVARTIGIGAVKYADLSQNRISDFVFSFDKMLSLTGNTAPYLIYAYVRICSLARKAGENAANAPAQETSRSGPALELLETPEELELGQMLLRLPEAIDSVANELLPNRLTDYLFELSQVFSRFYTNNRVLGDPREATRLALCDVTARTLKLGLGLLGIGVIAEM